MFEWLADTSVEEVHVTGDFNGWMVGQQLQQSGRQSCQALPSMLTLSLQDLLPLSRKPGTNMFTLCCSLPVRYVAALLS